MMSFGPCRVQSVLSKSGVSRLHEYACSDVGWVVGQICALELESVRLPVAVAYTTYCVMLMCHAVPFASSSHQDFCHRITECDYSGCLCCYNCRRKCRQSGICFGQCFVSLAVQVFGRRVQAGCKVMLGFMPFLQAL